MKWDVLYWCSFVPLFSHSYHPALRIQGRGESPDWEAFATQYRRLAADGKFELAERLWNSKYAEMEQYVQTLPAHHKEAWTQLDIYSSTDDFEETRWEEGLITFLEVTSSDNPYPIIAETPGAFFKPYRIFCFS
ncbi:hypothetical protein LC065_14475 [Halobacillus litoralis]|uniref:hypothetical protein n=1 Tax=Halobacillus litoralis TaxID=45668 RepID=UPI00273F0203|nr:hypothetical protein [Halobacillus litoralis]WLR46760.1 hypothetical protein LC065_14475 [Halobacillus litoralis]